MPSQEGTIIRNCHSDATAFSAERATNSFSLWLAKTGKDKETYIAAHSSHAHMNPATCAFGLRSSIQAFACCRPSMMHPRQMAYNQWTVLVIFTLLG